MCPPSAPRHVSFRRGCRSGAITVGRSAVTAAQFPPTGNRRSFSCCDVGAFLTSVIAVDTAVTAAVFVTAVTATTSTTGRPVKTWLRSSKIGHYVVVQRRQPSDRFRRPQTPLRPQALRRLIFTVGIKHIKKIVIVVELCCLCSSTFGGFPRRHFNV
jgi:hypothetical protein